MNKTLIKSNDFNNIQNVVDILETLDYIGFVRCNFELFDAIVYVLGFNFCIYNKNGEVISSRNFGFESQINIRYIEGLHYNILLSDNTLSCLNECGIACKSISLGMRLFLFIYDRTKEASLQHACLSKPKIIKTKDEKYFLEIKELGGDCFRTLWAGVGLSKILQGHEQEGKKIVHNTIISSSQECLLKELANSQTVCNFIAKSKGINAVNKDEAINYLNELYTQKNLNKIVEIVSMYSNLTVCFYDQNGNILYKSNQDNSACDLNIKSLGEDQYVNLIPIDQIKFFRDKNVLCEEFCVFNSEAFLK